MVHAVVAFHVQAHPKQQQAWALGKQTAVAVQFSSRGPLRTGQIGCNQPLRTCFHSLVKLVYQVDLPSKKLT